MITTNYVIYLNKDINKFLKNIIKELHLLKISKQKKLKESNWII
ncbi:hypothetical protein sm9_1251 [Methanobrevibacter millerae]|uniref:Uncharacterized protein n=1 Tax=Methanobrevibacter millerae TaxID=230361 RepID=A0A0U3E9M0_9EURY|nr:hypothetical protein sm9_1251 [Methanobrevibacter millerae]